MWMGFVAGIESLASIAAIRAVDVRLAAHVRRGPAGVRLMSTPDADTRRPARSRSCRRSARSRTDGQAGDRDAPGDPRRRRVRRRARPREAAGARPWHLRPGRPRHSQRDGARRGDPARHRQHAGARPRRDRARQARGPAEGQDARPRRRRRRGGRRLRRSAPLILILHGFAWLALVPAVPGRGSSSGASSSSRSLLLLIGGARRLPRRRARSRRRSSPVPERGDRRDARDAGDDQPRDDADEGPGPRGRHQAGGPALDEHRSPARPTRSAPRSRPTATSSRARSCRCAARSSALADWRAQINRHRPQVIAGAVVAGFVVGGGIAAIFGRKRRRR